MVRFARCAGRLRWRVQLHVINFPVHVDRSKGFADLGSQAVVDLVDGHVRELVLAAGVMELLGGLAIVFGGEACGAAMLLAALLPITVVLHNPLVDGSPAAMAHTLKNSSIIGALLMLLVGSSTPPLRRGKAKRD